MNMGIRERKTLVGGKGTTKEKKKSRCFLLVGIPKHGHSSRTKKRTLRTGKVKIFDSKIPRATSNNEPEGENARRFPGQTAREKRFSNPRRRLSNRIERAQARASGRAHKARERERENEDDPLRQERSARDPRSFGLAQSRQEPKRERPWRRIHHQRGGRSTGNPAVDLLAPRIVLQGGGSLVPRGESEN